jgi:23S rRNA pseudouridine955/2504/2580 synthase/23S rRNA pseudouridine1911/1915/1917 synthase
MQHIGHAIACDNIYGNGQPLLLSAIKRNYKLSKEELEERPILNRLALHSHKLIFDLNNEHYELEAQIPKDLRATLQQLRKHS